MAKIEGFRVRNFRCLKDVTIGKLWNTPGVRPLTPMTAVIGKNGVGKSTLFDAFGFLADCLKSGVEEACDLHGRGGYARVHSQEQNGPIEFEVYYREDASARPITYELAIGCDSSGRIVVERERFRQRGKGQKHGRPFSFLVLKDGKGVAWSGQFKGRQLPDDFDAIDLLGLMNEIAAGNSEEIRDTEHVELADKSKLGIATLGSLKQHPRIAAFRQFIESWYLSYFTPDAARGLPQFGAQKHLNVHGENLGNVVQFMQREHPKQFQRILDGIAAKIPGIQKIDTEKTSDGRLLIRFNDRGFQDPFYQQQVSDGTLKVFAYLLLLEDPAPPPFVCIEEPENGLYHKLLETLARELREHTERKGGSQVFVTTHQPYFVDALRPDEVWVLEKGEDGFAGIQRVSDIEIARNLAAEGLPLGGLWYSDYLDAR